MKTAQNILDIWVTIKVIYFDLDGIENLESQ